MILSYGLGVESTSILLHWLENPASRNFRVYQAVEGVDPPTFTMAGSGSFELKDLTVLTAMTGDEFPDLKRLVETHVFPRLRQHGVRYVQVARKSKTEPMVLLDDSRAPKTLHLDGAYKLSDELLAAGTVPQVAGSRRLCSIKSKGWPLDAWIEQEMRGRPFVQTIGFNAEEGRRVTRDQSYSAIKWPAGQKTSIYPLMHDWRWTRQACEEYIYGLTGERWPKSACAYCLAGDTEVPTREGIRPIRELAGGRHRLLVPSRYKFGGLANRGGFQDVEVRSFGVQRLWEVTLHRGRAKKVLRTTAEHRWFLTAAPQWAHVKSYVRTTEDLKPGDKLRTMRACAPAKEKLMPVAISQGFVFGDGSVSKSDERPASLSIYNPRKDGALLRYFPLDEVRKAKAATKLGYVLHIHGLPRAWKSLPTLSESRSFLLSWLAGYFAADGSVTRDGQAVLESASRAALNFVRDAASVCGVGYTKLRSKMRVGFVGRKPSRLFAVGLRVADLPDWFFLIKAHHERVSNKKKGDESVDKAWVVDRIQKLKTREEVFCAVVPGAQAFGLAEDLMTGNCPFAAGKEPVLVRFEKYPDHAAFSLFIEYVSMALNPRMTLYSNKSLMSVVQGVGDRDALKLFGKMLDKSPWAIYHVRRIYTQKAHADRSIRIAEEGKRGAIAKRLSSYGQITEEGGIPRVYVIRRTPDVYPTLEEMYVAAPKTMQDKERPRFHGNWGKAVQGDWSFMRSHDLEEDEPEEVVVPELSGAPPSQRLYLWDHDPDEYHEHPLRLEQKAWEDELADIIPLP